MTPDPFKYLPHLRGKLTPAEQSALRFTDEAFAELDRVAREMGRPADWRIPCELREASRRAVLGHRLPSDDLWVYAYGSLMWDPGIVFDEVRVAQLPGYQRRFTFKSPLGRGSYELPALMLALEPEPSAPAASAPSPQQCCTGLVFRVPAELAEQESTLLWRREMIRGVYSPTLLPMTTPQGDVQALVFASNPAHGDYTGEAPLEQTAAVIGTAVGPRGTNREYLAQLAAQLQTLQIADEYIAQLWQQVQRVAPLQNYQRSI